MILFVSGATGGHIYPGIAIAQALNMPSSFIVSRKYPAKDILDPYKLDYSVCSIKKLNIIFFPYFLTTILKIILNKKPKVILAMGGGICVPFAMIGWVLKIPVISFEQNTVPGRATRFIQFFAKQVITTFESTKIRLITKQKVSCLGNPTRSSYPINDSLPGQFNQLNGNILLVVGGSQGAKGINDFVYKHKKELMMHSWSIIHLTGINYFNTQFGKNGKNIISNKKTMACYIALPYIINMPVVYKKATVILCRAGATTLSEIKEYSLPAVLIPYPYAMDNHQWVNAKEFAESQPKIIVQEEKTMSIQQIMASIETVKNSKILTDNEKEISNSNNLNQDINKQSATDSICEFIKSYLK